MNARTWLSVFLSTLALAVAAQGAGVSSVTGTVVEASTGEPMAFASIALYRAADSALVTGMTTDREGAWRFSGVAAGSYYVQISFVGFETAATPVFSATGGEVALGATRIAISSVALADVEVTAEKSTYTTSIDRKVYNVGQDIQGQTGSASEVLENIPSVTVGVDGDVSLRGSSNVTFFVNGRPSALFRTNPAAALQQIPAASIERIEVITNPSARYKPDGTAGIINIVLKEDRRKGMNGTLMLNGGNNGRYNGNLTVNYNPGKMNVFGSYGFRTDNRPRSYTDHRTLKDSLGVPESYYSHESSGEYAIQAHIANAGLEYSLNKKNTISAEASGYLRPRDRRDQTYTIVSRDAAQQVTESYTTYNTGREPEKEGDLALSWEHLFRKEDHTLTFEVTASAYDETEDKRYTETYSIPEQYVAENATLIKKGGEQAEVYVAYVNPVGEDMELEAGYEGSFYSDYIDQAISYLDTASDVWATDYGRTSLFRIRHAIHSAYATFGMTIEDFSVMGGLRAEQTMITSDLVTLDSAVDNNYFKMYPSLHLAYGLGEGKELQLSYSRRVNRADGDEMNPFPEYQDPRNADAGNPLVKPEQIHSVEGGFQIRTDKITFVPSLYYRYTFDAFAEVSRYVNDTVLLTTFDNLASEQSAGVETIFSGQVKKIFDVNASANLFYNEIDASNLGYASQKSAFSWVSRAGVNIRIPKNTMVQLNAFYRSAMVSPQGESRPMFYLNFGMRQDIFKKRASLVLTVSDILNTLRWERTISTTELEQKVVSHRKSQIVYLGFTWRFGSAERKEKDDFKFDTGI